LSKTLAPHGDGGGGNGPPGGFGGGGGGGSGGGGSGGMGPGGSGHRLGSQSQVVQGSDGTAKDGTGQSAHCLSLLPPPELPMLLAYPALGLPLLPSLANEEIFDNNFRSGDAA